jgi:hypothetical protein
MATLKDGIMGGISGQIGNVVGASWKGIPYVRSLPQRWKDPKTKKQEKQRSRFTVTMSFLSEITPFVRVGFRSDEEQRMTAFNAAMSYNMKHAVRVGEQGAELDYTRVMVSHGPLGSASEAHVEIDGNRLWYHWKCLSLRDAWHDDVAMALAYNPAKNESIYDLNLEKREANQASLSLPNDWCGEEIVTYLAFKSAEGDRVSDSIFTGRITII